MDKCPFRSAYSPRERVYAPAGNKEFPIFELDESGELVKTDKVDNVDERIQSYKEEVLLSNIIKRCAVTGETLQAPKECFGDTTVLPQSLLEVKENQNKVQGFVNFLSDQDIALLNEKGFDDFISAKIAEKVASSVPVNEGGDNNDK